MDTSRCWAQNQSRRRVISVTAVTVDQGRIWRKPSASARATVGGFLGVEKGKEVAAVSSRTRRILIGEDLLAAADDRALAAEAPWVLFATLAEAELAAGEGPLPDRTVCVGPARPPWFADRRAEVVVKLSDASATTKQFFDAAQAALGDTAGQLEAAWPPVARVPELPLRLAGFGSFSLPLLDCRHVLPAWRVPDDAPDVRLQVTGKTLSGAVVRAFNGSGTISYRATVAYVKRCIYQADGLPVGLQGIYWGGKQRADDHCPLWQVVDTLDPKFLMMPRLRGGGTSGPKPPPAFADGSSTTRVRTVEEAPPWRHVGKGLNLTTQCATPLCAELVVQMVGSVEKETALARFHPERVWCPCCGERLPPFSTAIIGGRCAWRVVGVKVDGEVSDRRGTVDANVFERLDDASGKFADADWTPSQWKEVRLSAVVLP